jgi:hypothetical protein
MPMPDEDRRGAADISNYRKLYHPDEFKKIPSKKRFIAAYHVDPLPPDHNGYAYAKPGVKKH